MRSGSRESSGTNERSRVNTENTPYRPPHDCYNLTRMTVRSLLSATDSDSSDDTSRDEHLTVSRREALHDAGLIRRFNAGDAEAFTEIVARYKTKLFAIALRRRTR